MTAETRETTAPPTTLDRATDPAVHGQKAATLGGLRSAG